MKVRSNDKLVRYYASRIDEYERIYLKPERQPDLASLRQTVQDLLRDRDVLEIACGTGYWTEILARSARSILAADLSVEALRAARRKNYASCPVRFLQADAYGLESIKNRFNGALCAFWWSHVPVSRRVEFLRALHRKLKHGGLVVMIDNLFVPGSSTPISRTDGEGNTYQMRELEDGSRYEIIKNFSTPKSALESLKDGVSSIEIVELTHYWIVSYTITH